MNYRFSGGFHRSQARVNNGTIIEPHSMPWLVALLTEDGYHSCTGSIIGKRHILTAAHCGSHTSVAVGAHDLTKLGRIGKKVAIEKFDVYNENFGACQCACTSGNECRLTGDTDACCYHRDIAIATLAQDVLNDNDIITEKAILGPTSETDCLNCEGTCAGLYDASGFGSDAINPG